jgi:hypothetical protein
VAEVVILRQGAAGLCIGDHSSVLLRDVRSRSFSARRDRPRAAYIRQCSLNSLTCMLDLDLHVTSLVNMKLPSSAAHVEGNVFLRFVNATKFCDPIIVHKKA